VCVTIRRRAVNRKKAAQLLMEGKRQEARDCLVQCVDITPQMALELINVCQSDLIVLINITLSCSCVSYFPSTVSVLP